MLRIVATISIAVLALVALGGHAWQWREHDKTLTALTPGKTYEERRQNSGKRIGKALQQQDTSLRLLRLAAVLGALSFLVAPRMPVWLRVILATCLYAALPAMVLKLGHSWDDLSWQVFLWNW